MIVSRAAFLKVCGAALVSGGLPRWSLPCEGPAISADAASPDAGAARFRPHIGSLFTIESAGQRVRLTGVVETAVSERVEQYALNFAGPRGPAIPDGTYTFRHPSLGRLEMYITPVGLPGAVPAYQACFSRLIDAKEQLCRISS